MSLGLKPSTSLHHTTALTTLRVCICFMGNRPDVLHSAAQRLILCIMFEATVELLPDARNPPRKSCCETLWSKLVVPSVLDWQFARAAGTTHW